MIDIIAVKKDYILQEKQLYNVLTYLPIEKQNKIRKFRKIEDVQKAIISDLLVRTNIIKKLGLKNENILLKKNHFGKPFLKDFDNFHFNVSHSDEWIVCAFNDSSIGIDVEKIKQIDYKIAERFFSKQEYEALLDRESSQRLMFFYDLWTLKESYIKAIGIGLSIPLNSFSFIFSENGHIKVTTENDYGDYYFKQYNIDENYKMSVCSNNNYFPQNVTIKKVDEIFDEMLRV